MGSGLFYFTLPNLAIAINSRVDRKTLLLYKFCIVIQFQILKKSKKSRARLGVLKTPHGEVETPSLVPVATQAVVKTLTSEEVLQTKSQLLICNTFHLHLKPGENFIKKSGGLHEFMNWPKSLMTDSGGFQVFSLGFGHDLQVGKILKYFPGKPDSYHSDRNNRNIIERGEQPRSVKITDEGAFFKSPINGSVLFIGPRESIAIQERLGADIIFTFDECTAPLAAKAYIEKSLKRTHQWAKICQNYLKSNQALFGIVQGSRFKDLRIESAQYINSLAFPGFGIGGDLGSTKQDMKKILDWILPHLDENKPRHLLGIGRLEDIENIIKWGIDTFDCTVPTHYARRGLAFISSSNYGGSTSINLSKAKFLDDKNSLDKKCGCSACQNYKRNYIAHLTRAKEMTGMKLLTIHNLHFFNSFVEKIRQKIKLGKI